MTPALPHFWFSPSGLGRLALVAGVVLASQRATAQPAAPAPRLLFLDFSDGTQNLETGSHDDAPHNVSAVVTASPYPPFDWPSIADGTHSRADIVATVVTAVHRAFLPYNVLVGTERPAEGPYTTVMIGGTPAQFGFAQSSAGVALMDCFDREPSNIVFAFPPVLRGNLHALTITIAQEAAHAFGLEHTDDPADIMHPTVNPAQRAFTDRESLIVPPRLCGPAVQNSHALLQATVGRWPEGRKPLLGGQYPDIEPPLIRIVRPLPGEILQPPIVIEIEVTDESPIDKVSAFFYGEPAPVSGPPYRLTLTSLLPGPATAVIVAMDAKGNLAQTTVDLEVGQPIGGCALAAGAGRRPMDGPGGLTALVGLVGALLFLRREARKWGHETVQPRSPAPRAGRNTAHRVFKQPT